MSLPLEMTGQAYDQVLTQLAKGYEFVIKDDGLSIQLRMRTIDAIFFRLA